MRPSSESVASTSAEKREISPDICSWRAVARLRVVAHGAIEFFVVAHGVLEHRDRARQRADLVAALAERDRDRRVAAGDLFGDAGELGERLGYTTHDQNGTNDCSDQHGTECRGQPFRRMPFLGHFQCAGGDGHQSEDRIELGGD